MSWLSDLITPVAGSFVKDIGDTVKQFVTTEADRLVLGNKLTEIEAKFKTEMETLSIEIEKQRAQNASDINETMRAESASEHWPSYSWRPFIGFVFGVCLLFVVVMSGIIAYNAVTTNQYQLLAQIPALVGAFALLLGVPMPILGIASWYRGKMQADPLIPTDNKG